MSTAGHFQAVTPSDSTDLPLPCDTFWIGATGTIKMVAVGDLDAQAVTISAVPVGKLELRYAVRKIFATGTTCTGIVGLAFGTYP